MRSKIALVCFGFYSFLTFASDPVLKFSGDFLIEPKIMHKEAIVGQLEIFLQDDVVRPFHVKLDKPISDKTDFLSSEQGFKEVSLESGEKQLGIFYKLVGAPHKWYFVCVSTSVDGGLTYSGNLYKVKDTAENIAALLQNGAPAIPETWKKVGTTTLKNHIDPAALEATVKQILTLGGKDLNEEELRGKGWQKSETTGLWSLVQEIAVTRLPWSVQADGFSFAINPEGRVLSQFNFQSTENTCEAQIKIPRSEVGKLLPSLPGTPYWIGVSCGNFKDSSLGFAAAELEISVK